MAAGIKKTFHYDNITSQHTESNMNQKTMSRDYDCTKPQTSSNNHANKPHVTQNIAEKVEKMDALLPQTQCQLCEFSGCKPYAEAIATQQASLDRCLPGGVRVMRELGKIMQQDVAHLELSLAKKTKPPMVAVIDEGSCIGCTKCISACPVDAIVGSGKLMHRVITADCTGCELCLDPCPVDCIDMILQQQPSDQQRQQAAAQAREKYYAKLQRQENIRQQQRERHRLHKLGVTKKNTDIHKNKLATTLATTTSKANTITYQTRSQAGEQVPNTTQRQLTQQHRQAIIAKALAKKRERKQTNS